MTTHKVGDKVAWTMLDSNVMCGTVQLIGFSSYDVRRVDGGICTIKMSRHTWMPSSEDMEKATEFFTNMGR